MVCCSSGAGGRYRSIAAARATCWPDMELSHWVTGSMGHLGHLSRLRHRVTGSSFWPGVRPEFFRFSKKCPKCKTYIWNAEMTKVIVRCLLLDWNHWKSVHAMNVYFYLWLLKIVWPENTSSHVSRHSEFIIDQCYRVNWVSGSLDSRVTGSQNVTQFHVCWLSMDICRRRQSSGQRYVGSRGRRLDTNLFYFCECGVVSVIAGWMDFCYHDIA